MFPLLLLIGFWIIVAAALVAVLIKAGTGLDAIAFVENHLWPENFLASLVWIAVIGATPSVFLEIKETLARKKPHQHEG